jgi:hypothetical protein
MRTVVRLNTSYRDGGQTYRDTKCLVFREAIQAFYEVRDQET